jgi:sterol desaturase/sphingolipid hydroxylase (fatty acid hydroxylase superfamily)
VLYDIVLFLLGLFYGNLLEYFIHRYVFHKLGRKKDSLFAYHLRGHHVLSKKQNFVDLTESKIESIGLLLLIIVHVPLFFIVFPVWLGVTLYALAFKYLHGWQHKHPAITKKFMKWHWDHHMSNPNENYGVVASWSDHLFGTRKDR